jgi:uncharacterized membrane protein YccF (DUF307 family)
MTPMALLLNLLWLLFGGVWMAVAWGVAAVIMAITIIGLPWARAGRGDMGTGPLGVIGNVVCLVLAGWWLALGRVLVAIPLGFTIIGIPFAWALAAIALWPIGKIIVPRRIAPLGNPRPR